MKLGSNCTTLLVQNIANLSKNKEITRQDNSVHCCTNNVVQFHPIIHALSNAAQQPLSHSSTSIKYQSIKSNIVKTVHALTSNSCPILECRMRRSGNSSQRFTQVFQYSNRMFEISYKIFLGRELLKRRFRDGRGGPWRSSRFELECS